MARCSERLSEAFVLLSVRLGDIHLGSISQEKTEPSSTKFTLKITQLKFHSNLTGGNEFINQFPVTWIKIPV